MKKILLLALIASSAMYAEITTEMAKDAATAEAKSMVIEEVKAAAEEAAVAEENATKESM